MVCKPGAPGLDDSLGASMTGAGITVAGSAALPGVCHNAPSKAKSSNAPGDLRAEESERPADTAGGCVMSMECPLGAQDGYRRRINIAATLYISSAMIGAAAHTFLHISVKRK